jgi:two-component system CheB/CheR fusion protein
MAQIGITDFADYLDHLELHHGEFTALFNTILINVTAFFRTPTPGQLLRDEVLPAMLAAKAPTAPLRIWSAGCASGEEAYTLAIVLAELMGTAEFRDRVKIYATDVDDEALSQARQGSYSPREVRGIPKDLLERYFEPVGGPPRLPQGPAPLGDLRAQRPGPGRPDLPDRPAAVPQHADVLQRRDPDPILARFHFALADTGVLFLGKAEMLLSHAALFVPIDLRQRVFRKVPRVAVPSGPTFAEAAVGPRSAPAALDALRAEALLADPLAQVVVTADGVVAVVNQQAEFLFGVSGRDVGRPFRDLDLSYRPLELRRYIEQAQAERRSIRVPDVPYSRGAEPMPLEVQVIPLTASDLSVLGSASRSTTSPTRAACRTSWSRRTASWRRPTRSSSRPTRSWRPPTRSCSPRSRSWRPPTRSSSPRTRSWRR